MECSFSLFIPFRFHIHTEAGYNPVGRYGFVFSPRWQNEGIEKKRTRIPWLRSLRWGLLMRPIYRGFWRRREIVILFRRTWRGVNWHKKTSFVFFVFSPVFIDFFAGYRKSKKEIHFCLILSGATKKNLVRNTRKKQSWLCAKSSRRAHTQSVFMSLSGTWFISVCIYIYTHTQH